MSNGIKFNNSTDFKGIKFNGIVFDFAPKVSNEVLAGEWWTYASSDSENPDLNDIIIVIRMSLDGTYTINQYLKNGYIYENIATGTYTINGENVVLNDNVFFVNNTFAYSAEDISLSGTLQGSEIKINKKLQFNVSLFVEDYSSLIDGSSTEVVIPYGTEKIREYCFYHLPLVKITIPDSITSIGNYAFEGCTGLTEITIPRSVTSIGGYAFDGCSGLTAVHITDLDAWWNIDYGNFSAQPLYYAQNLYLNGEAITNLTVPESLTEVKPYTFYGAKNITGTLTIHDGVTSIGDSAFTGTGLTGELVIPDSVTSIGPVTFYQCTGLTSLTLGNSVQSIRVSAFYGCTGLTGELVIPDSVTSISSSAFRDCSGLTSVVIGSGVTTILTQTFYNCSSVLTYDFTASTAVPTLENVNAFTFINANCKIYVPDNLYDEWTTATNWSTYADYIFKASEMSA